MSDEKLIIKGECLAVFSATGISQGLVRAGLEV